jgi:hypothetical protein
VAIIKKKKKKKGGDYKIKANILENIRTEHLK